MYLILKDISEYTASEVFFDSILIALNETKGEFQNRIFNSESGAKDIENKPMPSNKNTQQAYSKVWGDIRKSKGRQIKVMDFNFTGELMNSIRIEQNNNRFVIKLIDDVKAKKMEHLKGKKIFKLSVIETEHFYSVLTELIKEDIQKILNKYK